MKSLSPLVGHESSKFFLGSSSLVKAPKALRLLTKKPAANRKAAPKTTRIIIRAVFGPPSEDLGPISLRVLIVKSPESVLFAASPPSSEASFSEVRVSDFPLSSCESSEAISSEAEFSEASFSSSVISGSSTCSPSSDSLSLLSPISDSLLLLSLSCSSSPSPSIGIEVGS